MKWKCTLVICHLQLHGHLYVSNVISSWLCFTFSCCTGIVGVGCQPQLSPGNSQLCTLDGHQALCGLSDYLMWNIQVVVNWGGVCLFVVWLCRVA